MSSIPIELKCAACGSKSFELPSDPQPDDFVSCAGCGAKARYEDLRIAAIEQAQKLAGEMLKDVFKGSGWKQS